MTPAISVQSPALAHRPWSRSTASRRAGTRPARAAGSRGSQSSRPSRRRCRLASSRVDPLTERNIVLGAGRGQPGSRARGTSRSSSVPARSSPPIPRRRFRRRRPPRGCSPGAHPRHHQHHEIVADRQLRRCNMPPGLHQFTSPSPAWRRARPRVPPAELSSSAAPTGGGVRLGRILDAWSAWLLGRCARGAPARFARTWLGDAGPARGTLQPPGLWPPELAVRLRQRRRPRRCAPSAAVAPVRRPGAHPHDRSWPPPRRRVERAAFFVGVLIPDPRLMPGWG